jgi:putative transposase
MVFEKGHLYHIYNQGNNRQRIFFTRDNYLFFLDKINKLLLPYIDVIAWCLMPNHFHMMVYVREVTHTIEGFTLSETLNEESPSSKGFTLSEALTKETKDREALTKECKSRTLNDSIGLLLRSYTRAINNQENRTGSLFRNPTKAECITKWDGNTPTYFNTAFGAQINVHFPEKEYPQVCFNYIHNNPVKAGLVKNAEEWEFSSYRDYFGLRNGKLINRQRANEFVVFFSL